MNLFGLFGVVLLIRKSATLYVGLPADDWNTASRVCSLESADDVSSEKVLSTINETISRLPYYLAWTKRRVNYSRWTAFIGCSSSFSAENKEKKTAASLDDCVSYCSGQHKQHLAYKDTKCTCLDSKPNIVESLDDCRQKCINESSSFACSGGSSTMIFEFDNKQIQGQNYATKDCLARKKENDKYKVMNCNKSNGYVCSDSSYSNNLLNWYDYQNQCLDSGNHILYGKNLTGIGVNVNYYWTPIFRTQQIMEDRTVPCDTCQCIAVDMTGSLKVRNCSEKLPFLCKQSCDGTIMNGNEEDTPRIVKLSIFVVIGVGVFVVILILVITILCMKIQKVKTKHQVTSPTFETTRRDNYPPPSKSPSANKARLRETYIDTCDTPLRLGGYHDVYDDVNKGFKVKG